MIPIERERTAWGRHVKDKREIGVKAVPVLRVSTVLLSQRQKKRTIKPLHFNFPWEQT